MTRLGHGGFATGEGVKWFCIASNGGDLSGCVFVNEISISAITISLARRMQCATTIRATGFIRPDVLS